ncbi:hypothetical protein Poli38472_007985 [Pythium oligandrum]|uniref:Uncharacterized protein n=1 Tax=Pythium oligandrum TaxID=41045 RepID=A0A8K1CLW6_PYTOL|nr:hypothetical protein Poli38472_007985 [Pythium oligandrum]|eukprot:TMW65343.1 hypothetical protein Poli38472_007985 [Pythium oligandrum]
MVLQKTLASLVAASLLLASPAIATQPREPVVGERLADDASAISIADESIAEAYRIWSSNGWKVLTNTSGILNEAKPVSGVFSSANVDLTRATAIVDAPAQALFDLLITPQGFQLIDPLSNPEDFAKPPLQTFSTTKWRTKSPADKKRLDSVRTEAPIPGLTTREFVVLNAVDSSTRIFVSKSVQHKADPGCSIYGPASCRGISSDPVRALNTFAVSTEPVVGDANKCVVRLINYADLSAAEIPSSTMNQINFNFLPEMVERFRQHFATST